MYYLTSFDDENIMQLLSYSKNYICKFMQANIINYFTSICCFESGKCGEEIKKLQKFEYLKNEKWLFNEIKNIFYRF